MNKKIKLNVDVRKLQMSKEDLSKLNESYEVEIEIYEEDGNKFVTISFDTKNYCHCITYKDNNKEGLSVEKFIEEKLGSEVLKEVLGQNKSRS